MLPCPGIAQTGNIQLGLQYYENGEYEKAIDYLKDEAKEHPNNQLYEALLNSYLALEDYREAEDLVEDFVRRSRLDQMDLYTDLIYVNRLSNDERGTAKAVEEIKNRVRANPGLSYSAGNALQRRGYPEIALEIFELAGHQAPGMNFDYQKALLYGELGDLQNMYRMYIQMVERSPNYMATVKSLLAQGLSSSENPENAQYLKELLIKRIQEGGPETMNDLLVFVYIQEKNFRGAFTQLKALDKRYNGNKAEIYNLGIIALNSSEYSLADKIFEHVLSAGRDNPFYEEALVQKLSAQRRMLEAEAGTSKADWQALQKKYLQVKSELKGLPEAGKLSIELAHLTAFRLDNIDSAVAILKNIIATGFISEEDRALAKIELGDILLYSGERWDAIIYYGQAEKAFEKSPIGQEAKFKRAKAAYYVGDFQWAQGIFDVLKASTSKLIANDAMRYSLLINDNIALDTSTAAMVLFAHADLLNYQDKTDSAMIVLGQLQAQYPGHSISDEVLLLRSEILVNKKDFLAAALDLQTLIDTYPSDILADDATFRLAGLYETQLNRVEDAKELYRKLFTEHPDSFFAAEARKRFRELRGDLLN